jgi:hypothetical protein
MTITGCLMGTVSIADGEGYIRKLQLYFFRSHNVLYIVAVIRIEVVYITSVQRLLRLKILRVSQTEL